MVKNHLSLRGVKQRSNLIKWDCHASLTGSLTMTEWKQKPP